MRWARWGFECLSVIGLVGFQQYVTQDISKAIHYVHDSGAMHNEIGSHPERYLSKNPDLPVLLKRLKDSGKQTFLLTNSSYPFANSVLKYLVGEDWRCESLWFCVWAPQDCALAILCSVLHRCGCQCQQAVLLQFVQAVS